ALDRDELLGPDLKSRIEGVDAVVHLDGGLEETRALLDAAGAVGATHVVLLSSATVYGAWPNNPVPLTEDAPLRPNNELDFAARVVQRLAWLRARLDPTSASPGLLPYTTHAWVVANDRIKAAGWRPTHSNEEAYIAAHPPAPWSTVSPQRRQELALGGLAALVVGVVAGVVLLIRRGSSRRA